MPTQIGLHRFKIDLFKVKSVCDKLIAESSLMIAYKAWL